MKLKFAILSCMSLVMFMYGCATQYTPVGRWELYVTENGKHVTTIGDNFLTIAVDGTFACTVKTKMKEELHVGTWSQKNDRIIFHDKSGTHTATIIGKNKIVMPAPKLKKLGCQFVYIRIQ